WWVPSRARPNCRQASAFRAAARSPRTPHDRAIVRTCWPMTAVAIAGVIQDLRGRREHLSAASIYEGLGDATNERWNAPGFWERRHAPVRPCPHTVACGFRGRIGADGDAR